MKTARSRFPACTHVRRWFELRAAHVVNMESVAVGDQRDDVRTDEKLVLCRTGRDRDPLVRQMCDSSSDEPCIVERQAIPVFERVSAPLDAKGCGHSPRRSRSASRSITSSCGIPGFTGFRPGCASSASSSGVRGSPRAFFFRAATCGSSIPPRAFQASSAARLVGDRFEIVLSLSGGLAHDPKYHGGAQRAGVSVRRLFAGLLVFLRRRRDRKCNASCSLGAMLSVH